MKAERTGGREGKGDRNSGDESVEAEGMEEIRGHDEHRDLRNQTRPIFIQKQLVLSFTILPFIEIREEVT